MGPYSAVLAWHEKAVASSAELSLELVGQPDLVFHGDFPGKENIAV
ncbi:MAG: hypothetical protein QS98_C0003G0050 [archaeon GW2011_AR3]|nr:MAG: hypothetical protein QS98_C0003G0050 [archaeon GW2011_AR3]